MRQPPVLRLGVRLWRQGGSNGSRRGAAGDAGNGSKISEDASITEKKGTVAK